MWYKLMIIKRVIEDLFIFPFVLWGRLRSDSFLPRKSYDIYFFFPFFHTGGAEKVHTQITHTFKGRQALIIFTRKSHHDAFYAQFKSSGHDIIDISNYTDNKWKYWNNLIYRGILAGYIETQKERCVVFNGHSNFAYKLSRWLRKDIPQYELIHSFNSFSYIRIPFIAYYKKTVMISKNRIDDHIRQYHRYGIPSAYESRIQYIQNAIDLPQKRQRVFADHLRVMYVGRSTPEKRVHLAAAIANQAREKQLPISMTFVGDVAASLTVENKEKDVICGNISDPNELNRLYREQADVLLIPSTTEGLPMVMMEAMAHGAVIMATPVGDIPFHIIPEQNGFLFSSVNDEELIITEAIEFLHRLLSDKELLKHISETNTEQAFRNYGLPRFEQEYKNLLDLN